MLGRFIHCLKHFGQTTKNSQYWIKLLLVDKVGSWQGKLILAEIMQDLNVVSSLRALKHKSAREEIARKLHQFKFGL